MGPKDESWLKVRPTIAWDPCEVWRQRILRPRLENESVTKPAQAKRDGHSEHAAGTPAIEGLAE